MKKYVSNNTLRCIIGLIREKLGLIDILDTRVSKLENQLNFGSPLTIKSTSEENQVNLESTFSMMSATSTKLNESSDITYDSSEVELSDDNESNIEDIVEDEKMPEEPKLSDNIEFISISNSDNL